MSEYWKTQDLEGSGLQTINQHYSRLKRNTMTAYYLCVLFPLGAHQFYLKTPLKGILYIALSIASVIALPISSLTAAFLLLTELVMLVIDIKNIDDYVNTYNKNLKMRLSLQGNTAPSKDYRGRYVDDNPVQDYEKIKSNEVTAFETKKNNDNNSKIYSFSEQEKLLRELSKKKKSDD